ncbi:MAG TPA: 2,3-bisphosphoglycerate-independent phosphoglycerate mutase [Thermomicrobiales bacterium]|nr:2,3-bisphosphoglycerate-independent phosphoglycerate mutase [Thermomicrobiales bacterium]
MMHESSYPVVLVILDGWGLGEPVESNAVWSADTPVMDGLVAAYPNATLSTSGTDVGLPEGQMGNSEVGHLNIGAGHIVYQWITRIDRDIEDGTFAQNRVLRAAFERAQSNGGAVHLMGLAGEGGVHAHSRHLTALIDMALEWRDVSVRVHPFTDGRDTAPDSGRGFLLEIEDHIAASPVHDIQFASLSGRYYAMDRDRRWERTKRAFDAVTGTGGPNVGSGLDAIEASYAKGITDEFIEPVRIGDWGESDNRMGPNDEAIFFNFRNDRARQLTQALTTPDFDAFDRSAVPNLPMSMTTMTRYEEGLPVHIAYAPTDIPNPIAKVISDAGLRQFHTAETEKYPHVTFFLNGGREEPFPGEDRKLVPSPKVATYDLQPEMSAPAVCEGVLEAIWGGEYHFIIVNFANPDMVGHTGIILAARKAVETVDACLGEIMAAVQTAGGIALVSADHGNADVMRVPGTDEPMTAHTTNPVPVVLVAPDDSPLRHATLRTNGRLSTLGTTVIDLLGLPPHPDMTEPSLLAQ